MFAGDHQAGGSAAVRIVASRPANDSSLPCGLGSSYNSLSDGSQQATACSRLKCACKASDHCPSGTDCCVSHGPSFY